MRSQDQAAADDRATRRGALLRWSAALPHLGTAVWALAALGHLWLLLIAAPSRPWSHTAALAGAVILSTALALLHRRLCRHPALALVIALVVFAAHPAPDSSAAQPVAVIATICIGALLLGAWLESSVASARSRRSAHMAIVVPPSTLPPLRLLSPQVLSRPPPHSL